MCRHYLFEISSHFIDKVYLYVKGWYILGNFLFNPFSTKQEIVLNFENEIRNQAIRLLLEAITVYSTVYILCQLFYYPVTWLETPISLFLFEFTFSSIFILTDFISDVAVLDLTQPVFTCSKWRPAGVFYC